MTKVILVANTAWYLYNFRRSLAVFLREKGMEVVMVSPVDEYALKLQEMGFRWIQWEVGRKSLAPWKELASLQRLSRIYRAEQPDLVHHHTIKPGLYGTMIARGTGVPGIINAVTGRGHVFLGEDLKIRALRWLVGWFYHLAYNAPNCVVIFENPTDQEFFIENNLVPGGQTRLIRSVGVDPNLFFPQPEPEGTPVILQASRMLWDKGVGVLVDAARLLRQRTQVRVALAGSPDSGNPTSISEKQLREWHEEGAVEWWGFRPDMNAVYNSSHIVVLPSMYAEGIPTVLLEAAACGRPVVSTTMPGCRDFVIDGVNGFLVPPGDPKSLADALEKLVQNPELRAEMGAAGRKLVLDKYTTGEVNQTTFDVYNQVLRS